MSDETLPKDRFAWLGKNIPPAGVEHVAEAAPTQIPEQVVGIGDSLGILRWLITPEGERADYPSGCRLLDIPVISVEIPREGT